MDNNEIKYNADLAYIHDVGYGQFAHGMAPGLLKWLSEQDIRAGVVVDLGCGSGIWAESLANAGYKVVGVDFSESMIDMARRRVPAGTFHAQALGTFALPACRAITALGEVLAYCFGNADPARDLPPFLARAAAALEPGGLLVFDLPEIDLDRGRAPGGREGPDWACLVRYEYNHNLHQLTRYITTFRQQGELYRRREEAHTLQLFQEDKVRAMLRHVGFEVQVFRQCGDHPLLPGRVGFRACKISS